MKLFTNVSLLIMVSAVVVPAQAQIVQIGPGGSVNVRAPFVRVYVGPNGETHVRAPFTNVTAPGYGYPVPPGYVVPQPLFGAPRVIEQAASEPTVLAAPEQISEMNCRQLKRFLRASALQLDQDLDGELARWKKAFLPGTIRDLVTDDDNQPLDRQTLEQLQPIMAAYDDSAADESLRNITSLASFQDVRESLAELFISPQVRLRRQLTSSSQQLIRDLGSAGSGESLKTYLALPAALNEESPDSQPSAEQLDKAISNYEALNRTDQFRAVAQLSSFQATRQRLVDYREMLVPKPEAVAPPEELELPPPKK